MGIITTHAEAKRRLPNTVSDAVVSIEVHGRDLRTTASQLGRQSQSLLTFLRGQPTERLRTDGMSFDPETQELRGQPDRIKGYAGRLTVSFRTAPEQLPALLAGCLENGATGLGQFGSSPREQEMEAARLEMVTEASQAALAQARAIATAVGQRIAGIVVVDVDPVPGASVTPSSLDYDLARASRPAPPVRPVATQAGDSSFSVTVVMVVRVAPARIGGRAGPSGYVVERRTSRYRAAQTGRLEAAALRRWVELTAIGLALSVSACPFAVLAPEPPAFGRGAASSSSSCPKPSRRPLPTAHDGHEIDE